MAILSKYVVIDDGVVKIIRDFKTSTDEYVRQLQEIIDNTPLDDISSYTVRDVDFDYISTLVITSSGYKGITNAPHWEIVHIGLLIQHDGVLYSCLCNRGVWTANAIQAKYDKLLPQTGYFYCGISDRKYKLRANDSVIREIPLENKASFDDWLIYSSYYVVSHNNGITRISNEDTVLLDIEMTPTVWCGTNWEILLADDTQLSMYNGKGRLLWTKKCCVSKISDQTMVLMDDGGVWEANQIGLIKLAHITPMTKYRKAAP